MKALLIEWKFHGKRAGNINPKDANFQCYGWQNTDVYPHLELRIVMDGKVDNFRDIEGITVLENDIEIDAAIDQYFPEKEGISSEYAMIEHMKQKGLPLDDILDKSPEEVLEYSKKHKLLGRSKRKNWHTKDL